MAVAKLTKLLITTHKSDENALLKALQKRAVVEINPYISDENNTMPAIPGAQDYKNNREVRKAIEILDNYKDKAGKKIAAKTGKYIIRKSEYENIGTREDFENILEEIFGYDNELKNNDSKIIELNLKIAKLTAWAHFKGNIEDLKSTDNYTARLIRIKTKTSEFKKIISGLENNKISFEVVFKNADTSYLIIAYHSAYKTESEEYLSSLSFDAAELEGYKGTIKENINNLTKSLLYHNERKEILVKLIKDIDIRYHRDLTVYLDYLENNLEIEKAVDSNFPVETASIYTAWVACNNKNKVFALFERFQHSKVYEIVPEKDEEIPIILDNRPIFKPFEIIINLYGVPRYFEIDPTPFVSLFFVIFFGLCLTDAGYGLVFLILSGFIFF